MPAPLTEEWIEEQLEICEKATPEPWWKRNADDSSVWGPDGDLVAKCRGSAVECVTASQNAGLIAATRQGYPLLLKRLLQLAQRRCTNCEFYAYYDGPLCGFSVDTDESFLWHRDPDIWYCADWKSREEAADD